MVVCANGTLLLNSTNDQMDQFKLNFIISGNTNAVLIIEAITNLFPELVIMEAVNFGYGDISNMCKGLEELGRFGRMVQEI